MDVVYTEESPTRATRRGLVGRIERARGCVIQPNGSRFLGLKHSTTTNASALSHCKLRCVDSVTLLVHDIATMDRSKKKKRKSLKGLFCSLCSLHNVPFSIVHHPLMKEEKEAGNFPLKGRRIGFPSKADCLANATRESRMALYFSHVVGKGKNQFTTSQHQLLVSSHLPQRRKASTQNRASGGCHGMDMAPSMPHMHLYYTLFET